MTVNVSGTPWTAHQFKNAFLKIRSGPAWGSNASPGRDFIPPEADQNIYQIADNTTSSLTALDGFTVTAAGAPASGTFDVVQPCVVLHNTQTDGGVNGPLPVVAAYNDGTIGGGYEDVGYDETFPGFIKLRYMTLSTDGNADAMGLVAMNAGVRAYGMQVLGGGKQAVNSMSGGIDFMRSYTTSSSSKGSYHVVDGRGAPLVESSVLVNTSSGNGLLSEATPKLWVVGSWMTAAGAGPAIEALGPSYVRMQGNNYVTSASGPGVEARRGGYVWSVGVLGNATGNSGTWGLETLEGGHIVFSSSTTATGATGDTSCNGTETDSYTVIRAAVPPTSNAIFGNMCAVEGTRIGQE